MGNRKKNWARKCLREIGIPIYAKKDSQEICFIQDDYREFLKKRFPDQIKPGAIVDQSNKKLGEHKGTPFYTIGQREGLGIPYKYPLYVIKIDRGKNQIIAGPRKSKFLKTATVNCINWIVKPKKRTIRAKAKIRYQHKKTAVTLDLAGADKVKIKFDRPQESPTPGQAAVFYDKDTVLGGGWII